jgi:protein phosphatase
MACGASLIIPDYDFNLVARAGARTSVGQVRSNNEDNVNIWAVDGVVLALVADGMGGAAAGEEASRLAAEAIQADFLGEQRGSQELAVHSEGELSKRMIDAILDANRAVVERAQNDPTRKGMGTTSTLAMIRGNRLLIAHVGDSRVYYINGREGKIEQVTDDHSFVQALVASGHITEDQAKLHPMSNVLYRALGQSFDLEVDIYTHYLNDGDALVVCSDGLTRHLSSSDIAKIVKSADSPDEATLDLIELANERGGEDNISVIVVMVNETQEDDTLAAKP